MNLLVTLCARAGSKGVKSKNSRLFLGSPLVYYTLSAYDGFVKEYGKYFSPKNRTDLKNYLMHYQYNLEHNKLGAFKPIFTQYNIKFVKNKMEIPNNELRK